MLKFAATRWFKKLTEWARQLSDPDPAVCAKAKANIQRLYNFNKQHPLRTIYTLDEPGLMQRWKNTLRRKGQFFRLREGNEIGFTRATSTIEYKTSHDLAHEGWEHMVGAPYARRILRQIRPKERRLLLSHHAVKGWSPWVLKTTSLEERAKRLASYDKEVPGFTKDMLEELGLGSPLTHFPNVLREERTYNTLLSIHPDENVRKMMHRVLRQRWQGKNYITRLVAIDPKISKPVVLGERRIASADEYTASRLVDDFVRKTKRMLWRRGRRDRRFLTMARTTIWPWEVQGTKPLPFETYPLAPEPIYLLRALHHKHKPTITTKWYWDKL